MSAAAFTQNGAGPVVLAGRIATTNAAVDFASPVSLAGGTLDASLGVVLGSGESLSGYGTVSARCPSRRAERWPPASAPGR